MCDAHDRLSRVDSRRKLVSSVAMHIRQLLVITLTCTILSVPALAAVPAGQQELLLDQVPENAIAALAARRSSLTWARAFVDNNPAQRADLSAFLVRTVGVDLTGVEGMVLWSSQIAPTPTFAGLLRIPNPGLLRGPKAGTADGVDLIRVGTLVAAAVPMGVLVGSESEVRAGIAVALKRAPALSSKGPLGGLLAIDRAADFVCGFSPMAVKDPSVQALAQQYGARLATFFLRPTGQFVLEVAGDGSKLKEALALLLNLRDMMMAKLKEEKAQKSQGDDVIEGLTAILAYHQSATLWKESEPRLVGDKLVMTYQLPELKSAGAVLPIIGVLSAIAVPAFTKYVKRSKTVEATMNVRKLADAALSLSSAKKKPAWPKSTQWTPAAVCCGQPGDKCAPDAAQWKTPTWSALNFSVDEPHYYQYRVTNEGQGKKARLVVEARGDLDCDGTFSSYKRAITVDPQGGPQTGALEVENDVE
jgi:type II secretory pathway pseudopilin PulG